MVKYYNNLRHEQAKSEVLVSLVKKPLCKSCGKKKKKNQSDIATGKRRTIFYYSHCFCSFYAAKIPPKNPGDLLIFSLNQRGRGLTNYTPNNTVAFLKIFLVENAFIYRSQLSGDTLRLMESMKQASESESQDAALQGLSAALVGS